MFLLFPISELIIIMALTLSWLFMLTQIRLNDISEFSKSNITVKEIFVEHQNQITDFSERNYEYGYYKNYSKEYKNEQLPNLNILTGQTIFSAYVLFWPESIVNTSHQLRAPPVFV